MAINKKIIHFKKKEDFDNEVANENILDHSIVFIQDSKEISTHGTVYKTVNWSVLSKPELYEWVDLGLPSGILWGDRNVGATKPEEYGLYFAWGETEGYENITIDKQFTWDDYKFGTEDNLTKYNNTDGLTTLELSDDAAYTSDDKCRMPTNADFEELTANTTSTWETLNGVYGKRFTASNGNSIFVPATGDCYEGSVYGVGSDGYLWSSSLDENVPNYGWYLGFGSDVVGMGSHNRYGGLTVRPVKSNN